MVFELARASVRPKPWGVLDLRPWSNVDNHGSAMGEIWYERPGETSAEPSLLIKLLFTDQPLSIQVHPDDEFAQSMGLPNGKTEAWYVLSAPIGARIAIGLTHHLTAQQLRAAISDGSIADIVVWRAVSSDDVIFIPAGTIHAIGAGLVIAEIQQRSDATFRMFDFGRNRELHAESAILVADAGPAKSPLQKLQLTNERVLLVCDSHFIFERIDLAPNSAWCLEADRETWLLIVGGDARIGSFDVAMGDAIFAQSDRVNICAGGTGMVGLVAYTGGTSAPHLLQRVRQPTAIDADQLENVQVQP